MYFTTINILLGISFFTIAVLSTLLFLRSRTQSSVFLSLSACGAGLWIASTIIFLNASQPVLFTIGTKGLHVAGIMILTAFVCFSYTFSGGNIKLNKKFLFSLLIISVLFIYIIVFTENIVQTTRDYAGVSNSSISFGNLYPCYSLYILLSAFLSYYFLIKKSLKTKSKLEKVQLLYIGIGTIVSLSIGLVINIIWPFFGIFNHYWLGPFLSIFFVVFATYAIFKHHLFNIKVISVELFSALMSVFVLVDALLSKTKIEFILKFGLFMGVVGISILIIRSILNEIKTKEQLSKLSEELRGVNEELKKLDQAKSEFLSIASHQLRTPLTAMKGYSSMLLEEDYGVLSPKIKEVVDKIYQSSGGLATMIEDFLNVSRIEMGKMKYEFSNFDFKKVIDETITDFATNNKKAKTLDLQFATEGTDFNITADKNKITQVVSNLIDNSIKYTPKGFIKALLTRKPNTNIVLLKIEDSGIGISKETLPSLFQKFTRAKGVSRLHTGGTGLGLYVARKIVEDHGGIIWAESKGEGKGSAFFVELPIYPAGRD